MIKALLLSALGRGMVRMAKWKPIDAESDRAIELRVRAEAAEAEVARLRAELPRAWEAGRDAAAKSAGTYCYLRTVQGRRLKSPAVFTTHTWQGIEECIRALTPPADLAKGGEK